MNTNFSKQEFADIEYGKFFTNPGEESVYMKTGRNEAWVKSSGCENLVHKIVPFQGTDQVIELHEEGHDVVYEYLFKMVERYLPKRYGNNTPEWKKNSDSLDLVRTLDIFISKLINEKSSNLLKNSQVGIRILDKSLYGKMEFEEIMLILNQEYPVK